MLSLRKEKTINSILARLSKSINLIQSWTTSFVKKKFELKKNEKKKNRNEVLFLSQTVSLVTSLS